MGDFMSSQEVFGVGVGETEVLVLNYASASFKSGDTVRKSDTKPA